MTASYRTSQAVPGCRGRHDELACLRDIGSLTSNTGRSLPGQGLTDESAQVGDLPEQQQMEDLDSSRPTHFTQCPRHELRQDGMHPGVLPDLAGFSAPAKTVIVERASTIVVLLSPETSQTHRVRVHDHGIREKTHRPAPKPPAIAEITILRRREGKGGVETTQVDESTPAQGDVVGGEEPRIACISVVERVDRIQNRLTRQRIDVAGKCVGRATAEEDVGRRFKIAHDHRKPLGIRSAIIVDEGDESRRGFRHTTIASRRRTGVFLTDAADVEFWFERPGDLHGRSRAAIVDHDDLETIARKNAPRERIKALTETFRPVVCRDHD